MPIRVEVEVDSEQPAIPLAEITPGENLMIPGIIDEGNKLFGVRCLANDFGGEVFVTDLPDPNDILNVRPFMPENKTADIKTNDKFCQEFLVEAGKIAIVSFKHSCSGIAGTPN